MALIADQLAMGKRPTATILVVDDELGVRESLRMILKDEYRVLTADCGEAAEEMVRAAGPDAVLLDIRLGRSDGIEVLRSIRAIDSATQVAMITAYATIETARLAMQLGAVDYLTKPFDCTTVRGVVCDLVARKDAAQKDSEQIQTLRKTNEALKHAVTRYQDQMQDNYTGTVIALISAIDAKDRYTRDHSVRVSLISQALAEEMGLNQDQIRTARLAGLIHDIGKIGISESVLRKAGKLTPDEWTEMKRHPALGADIISPVPSLAPAVPGVLEHHERPDGKGYPRGLSGNAISIVGNILSVADSVDAMSSDRVYRGPMPPDRIVDELLMGTGAQWAADVVDAAIRLRLPRRHHEYQAPPGRFPFDERM
jgi:response regulator RpfG family c-di-GMP phosphodiesterase